MKRKINPNNISINVTIYNNETTVVGIVVITGSGYWIVSDEWYIGIVEDKMMQWCSLSRRPFLYDAYNYKFR